jgi:protein-tyrosine phosphatase
MKELSVNAPEPRQRHLVLEGSYNVRDIGGYTTLDGRLTRWKTLLRADNLSSLSTAAQRFLLEYPIQTIIDLRRTAEVNKAPGIFARYYQLVRRNEIY